MTVNVTKPQINLREKISEVDKPSGIAGEAILRSETPQEVFNYIGAGRRNLIINGAMQVAQRGTSSTTNGYGSVDRFAVLYSGGTITHSQESLSSGDPYDAGFRTHLRATVSSAGSSASADYAYLLQYIEAQNIANSGWNYTSSSSYVTIQFWVRSSVAGTYYCVLRTIDGTNQGYVIPVTLSANTWTKVTQAISGNSGIQIDNNNAAGLEISVRPFVGANYTDSGVSTNTWYVRSSTTQTPDYTNAWQQTSGATFDLTGVQLEVGKVATPFEHRSYGEELALCQRYALVIEPDNAACPIQGIRSRTTEIIPIEFIYFPTEMRASPSITYASGGFSVRTETNDLGSQTPTTEKVTKAGFCMKVSGGSYTSGEIGVIRDDGSAKITLDAEL